MRDPDIDRRTLLALRGNDPMTTHINTIVDYSLFWILSVRAHCEAYGDMEFLRDIYPKMVSLMEFCGGQLDDVMETIRSYWGGMLERGAVTFWEEYDPEVVGEAQYDMYGDRFGKSLCHAWAASPIYLLSKYFRCFEDFEITVR